MLREEIVVASAFPSAFCSQLTRQWATTRPVANPQPMTSDLNTTRIYVDADACPRSFAARDRSAFLSTLDQTIRRIQRQRTDQPAEKQG